MEFLNYYLASHRDIKSFIYLVGKNASIDTLVAILKTTNIEKIYVDCEDFNRKHSIFCDLKTRLDDNDYSKINEISNDMKSIKNVIFSNVESIDYLNSFSRFTLDNLIGFQNGVLSSFSVWESFRKLTNHIVIATKLNEKQNEVLDWQKNLKSPIELSVIIPTYNVKEYLPKCIESLLKWESDYVEYIFVNDGSTDESEIEIKKYSSKDKRIKLLNKENGGCASARQHGIEHSNGRYIGFVDADDFIDPSMFEKLFSRALSGTYEISYCGYNEYYEDTKIIKPVRDVINFPYTLGTSIPEEIDYLIAHRQIGIWRGIYLRNLLLVNNIKFYTELRRYDDLPFKIETLARAKSVVSVPEYLYFYQIGRKGQDTSMMNDKLFIHFDIFNLLDEFFKNKRSSKQISFYKLAEANTHLWALSNIDKKFKEEYIKRLLTRFNVDNKKDLIKKFKDIFRSKEYKKFKKLLFSNLK